MINLKNLFNHNNIDGDDFASLKFCKMHGNGNDFVVFCCDELQSDREYFDAMCEKVKANAVNIADRNFGIGCDQIVTLMKCKASSAIKANDSDESADLNCVIRLYNADGTCAAMCGNALRCITGLVCDKSESVNDKKNVLNVHIEADNIPTRIVVCVNESDGVATVDMGRFAIKKDSRGELFVNVGNNHKIVEQGGIIGDKDGFIPVPNSLVPDDEYNVNYMNIIDDEKIAIATVERGAGLTLSCGSGACASAIYHQFKLQNNNKLIAQNATTYVYDAGQKITINDKALCIKTRFIDVSNDLTEVACGFVFMTGKYKYVFCGEIILN